MSDPIRQDSTETYEPVPGPRHYSRFFVGVPQPILRITASGLTNPGKVRPNNEDSYLILAQRRSLEVVESNLSEGFLPYQMHEESYTLAVADGMGGQAFGEVASSMALRTGVDLIQKAVKWTFKTNSREIDELEEKAAAYFELIDQALIDFAGDQPRHAGMGTTLTVCFAVGSNAFLVHAGDSRAYLLRSRELIRLTRDHTLAQELADLGAIPQEDVDTHRLKRVLTNCLGGPRAGVEPLVRNFSILDGDILLLCTDGLTDLVGDEAIARVLGTDSSPAEMSRELVNQALEAGGRDNITVVAARIALEPFPPSVPSGSSDIFMSTLPSHAVSSEARTLPAQCYTDPSYHEAELDAFFRDRWVCVGRAEALEPAGAYLCPEIAGESLIVLRDEQGNHRAFFNVCRHRGTRLCNEPAGQFAGTIQCPYHAWTYGLDGQLIGAPHMDDVEGFQRSDYPLIAAAVTVWEGHLFVHPSPSEPADLAGLLAPLAERFAAWTMADLRESRRITYDVKANWKLLIHNYSECLHCPINHPALQKLSHYMTGANEPPTESWLGGAMDLRDGVETLTLDGRCHRPFLPSLSTIDRRRVHYYAILPNLLLSLHPDYMMTHWLFPRAVDRTEVVCAWHFHPDAIGRPDFDPDDAVAFWDLTNREDWELSELTQQGLTSRAFVPGPYSNREDLLRAFDRIIRDRMSLD